MERKKVDLKSLVKIIPVLFLGVLFFWDFLSYLWDQRFLAQKSLTLTNNRETDYDKVVAIHKWISSNIQYIECGKPPNRKILRATACEVIKEKKGTCGDFARLNIVLLKHAGIKARRLYLYNNDVNSHVLNEVKVDNSWIIVDTSRTKPYQKNGRSLTLEDLIKDPCLGKEIDRERANWFNNYTRFNWDRKDTKLLKPLVKCMIGEKLRNIPTFYVFEQPKLFKTILWFILFVLSSLQSGYQILGC